MVFTDGLARPTEVLQYDPAGNVHMVTHYDNMGRAQEVSAPYRTGESAVYTSTTYDVLGRPVTVTNPDSSTVHFDYNGNRVTVTDEANVQRRQTLNGLGQLTKVEEPNPTLDNPVITTYGYNVSGALLRVDQPSQFRTFNYNWLGQLTAEDHPESGITIYTYDDAGRLNHRHDARGIDTDYTYDVINRLLTTVYSDGTTPMVTNTYDQTYTGMLTTVKVGPTNAPLLTTTYAYTAAGMLASETRNFSGVAGSITSGYSYDYD
jgi:YD repeat-containing protein